MDINLTNKKKNIEDGATEKVSFNGYDIYNSERKASTNVRLMCNVGVICDGTLFNPLTEVISGNGQGQYAVVLGIDNVNENTSIDNVRFGADVFNLPSLRFKKQPFIDNQIGPSALTKNNLVLDTTHYVKNISWGGGLSYNVNGFSSYQNVISKFLPSEYRSLESTYSDNLKRKNGWFGFDNPVSMRHKMVTEDGATVDALIDYENGNGVFKKAPGTFTELYPNRELYGYAPVYSDINKRTEYNWLTYVTYPAKNIYDTNYLIQIRKENEDSTLKHYGIKIWFVDEGDDEITYFRTVLRNGFNVGDVVNVYSGTNIVVDSYEVVDKPDDYSFALNMNGSKFFEWTETTSNQIGTEDRVYYNNDGVKLTKKVVAKNVRTVFYETTYRNNLSVVRVDNYAECMYYVRMFKALPNKPSINQNSFAVTSFNMGKASVLFMDDIDISKYTDNLGRPISDIFLTSIKNNEGYGKWYSYSDVRSSSSDYNRKLSESRAFTEVDCSFVMDDFVCDPTVNNGVDYIHKNSIQNLQTGKGIVVLTENSNEIISECHNNEFYGDFCEYSPNSFNERILQSAMHRFNTAQREAYNFSKSTSISSKLIGKDINPSFQSGWNTPTRHSYFLNNIITKSSGFIKNETNGYYYQPHHRIRIRTYGLDLTTANAIKYKVLEPIDYGTSTFNYGGEFGGMSVSGASCTISVERLDDIALNSPVILYYMSPSANIADDIEFYGKIIARYDETLYTFMLDEKTMRGKLNECMNAVSLSGSTAGKLYVLRKPENVPSHAILTKDRSFTFSWRELITNGYDTDSGVETYPFANNAFYVEKNINLYLRRQREVVYGDSYTIVNSNGEYNYIPESEIVDEISTTPSAYDYENRIKEIEEC